MAYNNRLLTCIHILSNSSNSSDLSYGTVLLFFVHSAFYAPKRLYQPFFGDTTSRKSEDETVEAYRGGYLDDQNVVRNCDIYSDYQGDAIFFAFQPG